MIGFNKSVQSTSTATTLKLARRQAWAVPRYMIIGVHGSLSNCFAWAVVVTQLVEWSLPTPAVHGSNPIIVKL